MLFAKLPDFGPTPGQPLGRFIKNKNTATGEQPARNERFLLVSAAEAVNRFFLERARISIFWIRLRQARASSLSLKKIPRSTRFKAAIEML